MKPFPSNVILSAVIVKHVPAVFEMLFCNVYVAPAVSRDLHEVNKIASTVNVLLIPKVLNPPESVTFAVHNHVPSGMLFIVKFVSVLFNALEFVVL